LKPNPVFGGVYMSQAECHPPVEGWETPVEHLGWITGVASEMEWIGFYDVIVEFEHGKLPLLIPGQFYG